MKTSCHRPNRVLFCGGILLVLVASFALAEKPLSDWTQYRGPGGLGISPDKGLPTTWSDDKNVLWKVELPGPGTSSPCILGKRIYLTCYSGTGVDGPDDTDALQLHVLCLDRDNKGKVLWTKKITPKLPEQKRIREGHGYASSTPAADATGVYCFFGKTGVIAFDHSGKQLWQTSVGTSLNGWGSSNSPVLHGNLVIVNASVESESIVALNKKTGKEVWRVKGIKESWNTPLLAKTDKGKTELVVAIFGKVLGLDPDKGKQLWSCDTGIRWYMVPSLVADKGIVYCIGGRTSGALAIRLGGSDDVTKTHRLWTASKGSNVPSPVFHDGHLYWMSDSRPIAYCANAKTGKIVYEETIRRGNQVYASPVLCDGKIYYVERGGRTLVVEAKPKFKLLGTNELERRGMFNASPAIAGGRLYLRSDKYLYCVGTE